MLRLMLFTIAVMNFCWLSEIKCSNLVEIDEPRVKPAGILSTVDNPLAMIPVGVLLGSRVKSRKNRDIFSFRRIRFAKAPIGELRFQPPESIAQISWLGVYNATTDGPACLQATENFGSTNEDCLFLNVHTPKLQTKDKSVKLPVLVYFHEGALHSGSGSVAINGPQYLLDNDIVLVTPNYRLATFGFLSTGTSHAPGNQGMKDQVMALKWIKENIESFGGDPNLVTICGYGASATTVLYHMLSPMSKGLFHRVISMSSMEFPVHSHQRDVANKQASLVGCPSEDVDEMINCLKSKPTQEFINSFSKFQNFTLDPVPLWRPVIEADFGQERFLVESKDESLKAGRFTDVPLMMGVTQQEFAHLGYIFLENKTVTQMINENFHKICPGAIKLTPGDGFENEIPKGFVQWLKMFYLDNKVVDFSQVEQLGKLFGDLLVNMGSLRMAYTLSEKLSHPVYFYELIYKGAYSHFYLPKDNGSVPIGPIHQDDLMYLFYNSLSFPFFDLSDPASRTINKLTTMWANFARTGNPTPEANLNTENVIWNPMTRTNQNYMEIGCHLTNKRQLFAYRFQAWTNLFPLRD